jgi:hypothetical protein
MHSAETLRERDITTWHSVVQYAEMCLPGRYLETDCITSLFHRYLRVFLSNVCFCGSTVLGWSKYATLWNNSPKDEGWRIHNKENCHALPTRHKVWICNWIYWTIATLTTNSFNAAVNLHTLKFTTTRSKSSQFAMSSRACCLVAAFDNAHSFYGFSAQRLRPSLVAALSQLTNFSNCRLSTNLPDHWSSLAFNGHPWLLLAVNLYWAQLRVRSKSKSRYNGRSVAQSTLI